MLFGSPTTIDYSVGDTIMYYAFGDEARNVRVTNKEADVKNGRPGFDGIVVSGPETGQSVWGYDDQIAYLIRRAPTS